MTRSMRKHSLLVGFVWVLSALCSAACSSKDESTRTSITPEVYCQRGCATLEGCAPTAGASQCADTCQRQLSRLTAPRGDLLSYIATCVEAAECADKSDAVSPCKDEAVAVLAPSRAGNDFCANYERASFTCKVGFDKAKCFEAAKTYADSTLSEANTCVTKAACGGLRACFLSNLPPFEAPVFKPGT